MKFQPARLSAKAVFALLAAGSLGLVAVGVLVHRHAWMSPQAMAPAQQGNAVAAAPGNTNVQGEDEGNDEAGSGSRKSKRKWKDTGVYVDGKPVGILAFGELPIALKPVWREVPVSAEILPGQKGTGFRMAKERAYRFVDLLQAYGVDVSKVKEIHVYGAKFADSIVASGAELRKHSKDFMFRFLGAVQGDTVAMVPEHFGNGRAPDKMTGVMVYVDKTPPRWVPDEGFELNGELQTEVPYYGEPVRGGVRVYKDDRLAMVIKRKLLRDLEPAAGKPGAAPSWRLVDLLQDNGVDPRRVSEAWVVYHDQRTAKFNSDQLSKLTFEMGESGNEILVGDQRVPANAIALHKKPISPEQLPQILAEEQF